jgi:hypothetical protein
VANLQVLPLFSMVVSDSRTSEDGSPEIYIISPCGDGKIDVSAGVGGCWIPRALVDA